MLWITLIHFAIYIICYIYLLLLFKLTKKNLLELTVWKNLSDFTHNPWRRKSLMPEESPLQSAELCSAWYWGAFANFIFFRRRYLLLLGELKWSVIFLYMLHFLCSTTFNISYPTNLHLEHSEKHQLKFLSFENILLGKERFLQKKLENGQCLFCQNRIK